ncbi:MAG: thioredoxin [Pedosphaera sp.]|nr:thioredoxin [Pedosphaera sp.]
MASLNVLNLTETTFSDQVLNSAHPILVDFWAEWCGPCKMIAPILDELAEEYSGRVAIGKVDVDSNQNLAVQYGVSAIPTLLLFKGGHVVEQLRGLRSKKDLKTVLDKVIA